MRNFSQLLMVAAMIFTCNINSHAQTADEIIEKHITAIGGLENWEKVTSVKITGSMNFSGVEIPITITTLQKKGQRVEYTVNGMTGYQLLTTTGGWGYTPFAGQTKPEAVAPEKVKESQDDLDIQGPLIDYKAKGNQVTFLGKDQVDGTECYKLKVVCAGGKEKTMFIDAANYYHIRTVEKSKANGKEEEDISNYGNFRKLPEGIVFAMSVDEGEGPATYKTVEINKPIDETIFKPSETKK